MACYTVKVTSSPGLTRAYGYKMKPRVVEYQYDAESHDSKVFAESNVMNTISCWLGGNYTVTVSHKD